MKIGLIPIDNRPCTMQFPCQLGRIIKTEIIIPPAEILGDFLQPGNTPAIRNWVMEKAAQLDVLIVSVDMLCYGGLINSREGVINPDEAIEGLKVFARLKEIHPQLHIMGFNVIMRTSVTVRDDKTAVYWRDLGEYLFLNYKEKNSDLSVHEKKRLNLLDNRIPPELLQEYCAVRMRNHQVNSEVLLSLARGDLDFVILCQEDATLYGPHKEEQMKLEEQIISLGLNDDVVIYNGTDEAGMLLLARVLNFERKAMPVFAFNFVPWEGRNNIPPFEDRPLAENVKLQCTVAGIIPVFIQEKKPFMEQGFIADAMTIINCSHRQKGEDWLGPISPTVERDFAVGDFLRLVQEIRLPLGVADLRFANGGDPGFLKELAERIGLFNLAAYAGWNTSGNSLGTVLAHLSVFLAACKQEEERADWDLHYGFLLNRFLDDVIYQAGIRQRLIKLISDQEDFGSVYRLSPKGCVAAAKYLQDFMMLEAWSFYELYIKEKEFTGQPLGKGKIKVDFHGVTTGLPWGRLFEADIKAKISILPEV
ncbi:MAG TPA: hypothetical protein DEB05_08060 [Firmicutes bacterium]|nr:hypothetical protein [Bacillota bacterium]